VCSSSRCLGGESGGASHDPETASDTRELSLWELLPRAREAGESLRDGDKQKQDSVSGEQLKDIGGVQMRRSCCGVRHGRPLLLSFSLDLQPQAAPRRAGGRGGRWDVGDCSSFGDGVSVPLGDLSSTASLLQRRWVQKAWKDLSSQHSQRPGACREVGSALPHGAALCPSPWAAQCRAGSLLCCLQLVCFGL